MQRKRIFAVATIVAVVVGFTPAANAIVDLAVAEGEPIVRPGSSFGPVSGVRLPPDAAGNVPIDPNAGAAKKDIADLNEKYSLTTDEQARADTILRDSQYLRETFGTTQYVVDQVGAWRDDESGRMVGAIYDITLERPINTGSTRLPVLENGQRQTFQATLTNVQKFTLIVSFVDNALVEVDPVETDGASFAVGPEATPRPTPTGDGDQ